MCSMRKRHTCVPLDSNFSIIGGVAQSQIKCCISTMKLNSVVEHTSNSTFTKKTFLVRSHYWESLWVDGWKCKMLGWSLPVLGVSTTSLLKSELHSSMEWIHSFDISNRQVEWSASIFGVIISPHLFLQCTIPCDQYTVSEHRWHYYQRYSFRLLI